MVRKSSAFIALVALSGLAATGLSQPTITHLQDIPVSGFEVAPTGITADSAGNAYIAGFEQKRVLKIANFASSTAATPSILFRTSAGDTPAGPVNWDVAFTGLFSADFKEPNLLVVAGDKFNDGMALVINTDDGSLVHQQAAQINAADRRVAGATWFGDTSIVAQFTSGTNYWSLAQDLQGFAAGEPAFYSGPTPSASRYIKHDGNGTIYVSYNGAFVTSPTAVGIHRIIGGTGPTLTGATNESDWYTVTVANSGSVQGIDVATIGSTTYAILALREEAQIHFIPTTAAGVNGTVELVYSDATAISPGGVTVADFAGEQYLLVTQWNLPTSPTAIVSVYGINGATLDPTPSSAPDWNLH